MVTPPPTPWMSDLQPSKGRTSRISFPSSRCAAARSSPSPWSSAPRSPHAAAAAKRATPPTAAARAARPPSRTARSRVTAEESLVFNVDTIEATAGEDFTITFVNNDTVPHNISIYAEEGGEVLALGSTDRGGSDHHPRRQRPRGGRVLLPVRPPSRDERDGRRQRLSESSRPMTGRASCAPRFRCLGRSGQQLVDDLDHAGGVQRTDDLAQDRSRLADEVVARQASVPAQS